MIPTIDVVVLTWNDGPLLEAAIRSALASEGVDVRVVVIDNGSDPPAVVPADGRVALVRNTENRGVASARNQGVGQGRAPYVCLLDSDARLLPTTLLALLTPLEAESSIGLAAPVFLGQAPEASAGRAPSPLRKVARGLNLVATYGPVPHGDERWWEVDFAIGACQLFRREAFDQVGGLDESYFYGPEDVDFCLRLRTAGWHVVQVPEARCEHPPRRRFRGLFSRGGARHAWALARHLWRHRRRCHRRSFSQTASR